MKVRNFGRCFYAFLVDVDIELRCVLSLPIPPMSLSK